MIKLEPVKVGVQIDTSSKDVMYVELTSNYVGDMGRLQEDYSAAKIRLVEFELLDTQPSHLHADLLLKNFYKLLEVIPTSFKVCESEVTFYVNSEVLKKPRGQIEGCCE